MAKKSEENLAVRKRPSQGRAQMTVDSILEATKRIMENEDYSHLTTNYIAEVSGVSIGTLYQYYPNKDAVIYALIEDVVSKASGRLRIKLLELMGEPIEKMMPEMLHLLLALYRENAFVMLRLRNKLPQINEAYSQLTTTHFTESTNRAYLTQHQDELSIEDVHMALFLVKNSIISNCISYLELPSPDVTEEEFVQSLSKMVVGYLKS